MYWPVARYHLKRFLFLALVAMLFSQLNVLIYLIRGHEKHFYEIISNLNQLFRRRCGLKIFPI